MDDLELEQLLADLESDRVERKESAKDKQSIEEAICAFANDLPNHRASGVVFIGAKDKGGHAGLPITDELLRNLASIRSDGNILPLPRMDVQKRTLHGHDYAVIAVQPAEAPPVRARGRICVRIGPRRAVASEQEESQLRERRRYRQLGFDLHPVEGATLQDLRLGNFREDYLPAAIDSETLAANHRSIEEQLASLRFIVGVHDPRPTVAGILVFGRDPRHWLPGAYVQFVRFDGPAITDPILDQAEISGPLATLIERTEAKLQAHLFETLSLGNGIHLRHSVYPKVALEQLFRNAVLHRAYDGTNAPIRVYWYSDRIEIHSPGGPVGQVTPANFGEPGLTEYRNSQLAEAMRTFKLIERFGFGIQISRKILSEKGNPPLEFVVDANRVVAIIRARN